MLVSGKVKHHDAIYHYTSRNSTIATENTIATRMYYLHSSTIFGLHTNLVMRKSTQI